MLSPGRVILTVTSRSGRKPAPITTPTRVTVMAGVAGESPRTGLSAPVATMVPPGEPSSRRRHTVTFGPVVARETLLESHTRLPSRDKGSVRLTDRGYESRCYWLARAVQTRRAACETKSGRCGGSVRESTRTVAAPAQVPSGHHTGADTQQIPGKASWRSATVAPGSRIDSRNCRHSRCGQQSGNATSPPGCAAYKTRPVAVRATNSRSAGSEM